eukprot:319877_1
MEISNLSASQIAEFVAFGYVRVNYKRNVPTPLPHIIKLFYGTFRHWIFNNINDFLRADELKSEPFEINKIPFTLSLFPRGDGVWAIDRGTVKWCLNVETFPDDVEYCGVYVEISHPQTKNTFSEFLRVDKTYYTTATSINHLHLSTCAFYAQRDGYVQFDYFVDVKYIKYNSKKNNYRKLETNQMINTHIEYQWEICTESISDIRHWDNEWTEPFGKDEEWVLHLEILDDDYNSLYWSAQLLKIPLEIKLFTVQIKITNNINDDKVEDIFDAELDSSQLIDIGLTVSDLLNIEELCLNVEMNIVKVYHDSGVQIANSDWHKYGVISLN